jgi:hypothetical protein
MTSPSWIEPPPKREPGCLRGCLFFFAFVVLGFLVLIFSIHYWGTHSHSAVARGIYWLTTIHAISDKPAPIPNANISGSDRENVLERWEQFQQAGRAGQASEIELTANDFNILIAEDPNLDGKAFATIEGSQLRLQISARLTQTIVRAAQYVNAQVTIEAAEPQAIDHPDLGRITVNGKPVPDDFLDWRYGGRSLRDYATQYAETARAGSFQIRDGKLVLRSRSD